MLIQCIAVAALLGARVAAQISAYQALVATARDQTATDEPRLNAAIEAFEPLRAIDES